MGGEALEDPDEKDKGKPAPPPLSEDDIAILKTYGVGPYAESIKQREKVRTLNP